MNSILKVKDKNGKWIDIPGIVGPQGPAGESGGVKTYAELPDKPTINGIEIEGIHDLWHYGIQGELKPGVNIKNINGQSLIGSGNIEIEGGTGGITEIPIASKDTLGGIKVGANLSITEDGTLNAVGGGSEEGAGYDDVPIYTIVDYEGEEIPDGWIEVEGGEASGPSAAMASLVENFTVTSPTRYSQAVVPLTRLTSAGNKFTLVDNGIKIGPGVSRISMGGQLTTNTQTNGSLYGICLVIYKNGVGTQNRSLWIADNGTYDTRVVMPKIVEVEEGDIIKMEIYIDASGPSITLRADSTYITVEEIPSEITNVTRNITHDITTSNLSLIYSTEEQLIGAWFDGKPLYQKTIDFGNLPNATNKSVAHGVANVDNIWIDKTASYFVDTRGHYYDVSDFDWHCNIDRTNVNIETTVDRTSAKAVVTIRYTKTTD